MNALRLFFGLGSLALVLLTLALRIPMSAFAQFGPLLITFVCARSWMRARSFENKVAGIYSHTR